MQLTAIIILLVVVMLAFLNAKIYNFIYGFVSLIGLSFILAFIEFLEIKLDMNPGKYSQAISYITNSVIVPYHEIFSYFKLTKLADPSEWLFYIFPIGVWLIVFIFSAIIRRIIKNR